MTVVDKEPEARVADIDDDPDIREAVRGLLRSVRLHVELFASVQEFLATARPDLPGCLVLDVGLPGRSGLDLKTSWPRQIYTYRLSSSAATPMSRCRFGP